MAGQGNPIQTIEQQLRKFILNNNISAIVESNGNQLILSDSSNLHPPLKITSDDDRLFRLKDTQDDFPGQVYVEMARWNGDTSFTQSEAFSEGKKWLTKLRRR